MDDEGGLPEGEGRLGVEEELSGGEGGLGDDRDLRGEWVLDDGPVLSIAGVTIPGKLEVLVPL